jgi:hypothetical protein
MMLNYQAHQLAHARVHETVGVQQGLYVRACVCVCVCVCVCL